MKVNRRTFLSMTSAAGAGVFSAMGGQGYANGPVEERQAYQYRMAFDAWPNDVRNEAAPLENWPYAVFDDKTVEGIIQALDVQGAFGYTVVDFEKLWASYAWPVDITQVVDKDHQRRIHQIIHAAHQRKMKLTCAPTGVLNWGYDEILRQHPELRTDNKHVMNPLREESWQWIHKVFDYVADNYDIDGFHLEAADQGRCRTPACMERWPDNVAYYSHVTGRMADYIRGKYPHLIVIATIQNFGTWGQPLTEEEKTHLIELSKKVDCLFDQGHRGTYIPPNEWKEFIPRLHCPYGTSGGFWVYPAQRWERTRWFLPYTQRTGKHIKELYQAGGRGVLYYQGPVINPGVEINIAFGGCLMTDVGKSTTDALSEVLEELYRPQNGAAHQALVEIFERAEDSYYTQWDDKRIEEAEKRPAPGELVLTDLFGTSPGAATYLMEPYLNVEGRLNYKKGLTAIYRDILKIENDLRDNGRIERMKYGIAETLVDINNIARCKGENQVWDDRMVGKQF